ncbi:MAG: hypothetical protein SGJ00_13220 [bacterium]|nr:hypothetical protein [bacterium]
MGLNQNHIVEELGGTRCAIVEKNISQERANFLTKILTGNGYTVVCAEAAPPKAAKAVVKAEPNAEGGEVLAKAAAAAQVSLGEDASVVAMVTETLDEAKIKVAVLLTLGVTDVKFNSINAVYGRILTAENGSFVTPDYWHQKESISNDQIPYYEKK